MLRYRRCGQFGNGDVSSGVWVVAQASLVIFFGMSDWFSGASMYCCGARATIEYVCNVTMIGKWCPFWRIRLTQAQHIFHVELIVKVKVVSHGVCD
jgi:hypothetical protein